MSSDATRPDRPGSDAATTLDLRGLKCPMPVLRTRRALARMAKGETLEVLCTDPLAGLDIPNLVRETGDELLASSAEGGETRFRIRRTERMREPPGLAREDPSTSASVDRAR